MSDQQQEVIAARRKVFEGHFSDYPDNAFDLISLTSHRFVSVEDDPRGEVWCKGHSTVATACRYLADQMTGGYKPLFIIDLDTGEKVELDLKAVVVPKSMGAVVLPMSTKEAIVARRALNGEVISISDEEKTLNAVIRRLAALG